MMAIVAKGDALNPADLQKVMDSESDAFCPCSCRPSSFVG